MKDNFLVLAGSALLALLFICTTVLVAFDKIAGDIYMGVVVGPAIGGLIGAVAGIKGVQSGSEASIDPPPGA